MTADHTFELLTDRMVPELNSRARLYRHRKTGAQLLSMENDDENKVFVIAFATPPTDSTGLPHIMEHSVLCGSRKYPVKEPFVELLKGSLQTFVNAFTFSDKTVYPLASQNVQDFYNLIDVYLDAVFYPAITPYTLQQEGWHYELDSLDSPLVYKGVVFNEMKGAYSDPDNYLQRQIEQSLFPDNAYGVDSGGDPAEIPNLTYEQFKRFHDTYYHPSNAFIFFYGDDDPEKRLAIVEDYLKDFEPIQLDTTVTLQPPFQEPRQLIYGYDAGDDGADGKRGMATVNWVLAENADVQTVLSLAILHHILIETPASPLRKALIDSGLGEDLAGTGLELESRQVFFSTGLKGIAVDDSHKVEGLIQHTLSQLAADGIEPEMIEAALNTVEFALRENNTGSFPRGIWVMIKALRTWLHGGDPLAHLAFEEPLATIKERLAADSAYFEKLITRYLIENSHRATVILRPDPAVGKQRETAEKERLAQARAAMSENDLRHVLEDTRKLKELQETPDSPEALATIPSLTLADLDRENKTIPLAVSDAHGSPVLYHDLFTNGIVYLDVGFNLRALPQEYLPLVTPFGRALLEMGTETEDFVRLSQRIGRKTGGIEPTAYTSTHMRDKTGLAWGFLRGKATTEQVGDLLDILRDVLLTVRLDNRERFRQIVLEEKAQQEAQLLPMGHLVLQTRLRSHFSEAGWVAEQIGGTSYLFYLRQLADEIETNWPAVLERLETMRRLLVNRNSMLGNVTLDAENWQAFEPQLADFFAQLPASSAELHDWSPEIGITHEGLTLPAQVNYVGKGADLGRFGYQPHGSIIPVTRYLSTTWIWERVRVLGGAYGGFVTFDWRSGVYTYLSYRDPNLLSTLQNYDGAARFLRDLRLSKDELVKSIIGAIGVLDAYQLPDAKGYTSMQRHLAGDTDAMRQKMRDEVLATTGEDFKRFADVLDQVNEQGLVVVLGSQEAIEAANAEHGAWLQVRKVL
jgi:Zn-dependent M16 (insulinase) family peptidase